MNTQNLVNWLNTKSYSSVLIVGSCPKLSSYFGIQDTTSVDNATIYQLFDTPQVVKKYDLVVLYGPGMSCSTHKLRETIQKMQSLPGSKSRVLLAVNNKFSISEFSQGLKKATKEHFLTSEEALNSVQPLLSYKEIANLLTTEDYEDFIRFPWPSTEEPMEIFSKNYGPGNGCSLNLSSVARPSLDGDNSTVFNEAIVWDMIQESGMFPFFAPSFLVDLSKKDMSQILYSRGSNHRKKAYQVYTEIVIRKGSTSVYKRPLAPSAQKHLDTIVDNYDLSQKFKLPFILTKAHRKPDFGAGIRLDYVVGEHLSDLLQIALRNNDQQAVYHLVDRCLELIDLLPEVMAAASTNEEFVKVFGNHYLEIEPCSEIGLIDLGLDNLIQNDKGLFLIDYEWFFRFPIPKKLIKQRLLTWVFHYSGHYYLDAEYNDDGLINIDNHIFVPTKAFNYYHELFEDFSKSIIAEAYFQNYVNKSEIEIPNELTTKSVSELRTYKNMPSAYAKLRKFTDIVEYKLERNVDLLKEEKIYSANLVGELNDIKNTKLWRYRTKLRKLLKLD